MAAPKKKSRKAKRAGTHSLKSVLEHVYPSDSPIAWQAVEVFSHWRKIVPQRVARVTNPVRLEDRTLIVHVSESAWIHELQFLKQNLIDEMNKALIHQKIDDIIFRFSA